MKFKEFFTCRKKKVLKIEIIPFSVIFNITKLFKLKFKTFLIEVLKSCVLKGINASSFIIFIVGIFSTNWFFSLFLCIYWACVCKDGCYINLPITREFPNTWRCVQRIFEILFSDVINQKSFQLLLFKLSLEINSSSSFYNTSLINNSSKFFGTNTLSKVF